MLKKLVEFIIKNRNRIMKSKNIDNERKKIEKEFCKEENNKDRKKYLSIEAGVPGVVEDGAKFLTEMGVSFTGSDTAAYDRIPPHHLPCHVVLLVENGIQIMEMLNLEGLSDQRVYDFLFIALPLKIRGGTGSPVRPIAIA